MFLVEIDPLIKLKKLPGLGPLTINLNIDAKTNVIDVNNILRTKHNYELIHK